MVLGNTYSLIFRLKSFYFFNPQLLLKRSGRGGELVIGKCFKKLRKAKIWFLMKCTKEQANRGIFFLLTPTSYNAATMPFNLKIIMRTWIESWPFLLHKMRLVKTHFCVLNQTVFFSFLALSFSPFCSCLSVSRHIFVCLRITTFAKIPESLCIKPLFSPWSRWEWVVSKLWWVRLWGRRPAPCTETPTPIPGQGLGGA